MRTGGSVEPDRQLGKIGSITYVYIYGQNNKNVAFHFVKVKI